MHITTGIYSLDTIRIQAQAAARQGVPLNQAAPYPDHSVAFHAYKQAYEEALLADAEVE